MLRKFFRKIFPVYDPPMGVDAGDRYTAEVWGLGSSRETFNSLPAARSWVITRVEGGRRASPFYYGAVWDVNESPPIRVFLYQIPFHPPMDNEFDAPIPPYYISIRDSGLNILGHVPYRREMLRERVRFALQAPSILPVQEASAFFDTVDMEMHRFNIPPAGFSKLRGFGIWRQSLFLQCPVGCDLSKIPGVRVRSAQDAKIQEAAGGDRGVAMER